MVWAEDTQHAIGKNGQLAWYIPDDLKLFRQETTGTLMIVGSNTWRSIGKPLPNRTTMVLTRQRNFQTGFSDVLVKHSINDALAYIDSEERDISIAGGAKIYKEFMAYATDLIVTRVDTIIDGDTFVEDIDLTKFKLVESVKHVKKEITDYNYIVERYERRN